MVDCLELFEPVIGLEKNPIIYALLDPNSGKIRYIGKSMSGISRPKSHTAPSCIRNDGKTKKANWLNSLLKNNQKPVIQIMEYIYITSDRETINNILYLKEQQFIKIARELNIDLTNNTDGGPGATNRIISDETRRKMSVAHNGKKLNQALVNQQKRKLPEDTETHRFCSKCDEYKSFNEISRYKYNHRCKKCRYAERKSRVIPGAMQKYNDSKKKSLTRIDITTNEELIILGLRNAAQLIGGKCSKTGIRSAIKSRKPYYGYLWRFN